MLSVCCTLLRHMRDAADKEKIKGLMIIFLWIFFGETQCIYWMIVQYNNVSPLSHAFHGRTLNVRVCLFLFSMSFSMTNDSRHTDRRIRIYAIFLALPPKSQKLQRYKSFCCKIVEGLRFVVHFTHFPSRHHQRKLILCVVWSISARE